MKPTTVSYFSAHTLPSSPTPPHTPTPTSTHTNTDTRSRTLSRHSLPRQRLRDGVLRGGVLTVLPVPPHARRILPHVRVLRIKYRQLLHYRTSQARRARATLTLYNTFTCPQHTHHTSRTPHPPTSHSTMAAEVVTANAFAVGPLHRSLLATFPLAEERRLRVAWPGFRPSPHANSERRFI